MTLQNKRVFLTGGSRGIGFAMAQRFLQDGAKLHITAKSQSSLDAALGALEGLGSVSGGVCDFLDPTAAEDAFDLAKRDLGQIDCLVNNAGACMEDDGDIRDIDLNVWNNTLALNLTSPMMLMKMALDHFLERQFGVILNNASMVAFIGAATSQIAYTASKGAMVSMTREIAVAYARYNIRANCICPGPVRSELTDAFFQSDDEWKKREAHMPLGRLGQPNEIAGLASFLISDDASYVTGANYLVDGGITAAYVTA